MIWELSAGVLYGFQFVADTEHEIRRPVTDEFGCTISEPRDGRVEVRGTIRCPVDGEMTVDGFQWGVISELTE